MSEYELPPLPYDYDALEPHISEQVLTWHHDTHHQGYVNGWNSAEKTLAANRDERDFSSSAGAIRNVTHNGSGHVLHDLFWQSMGPDGGDAPEGALADRIEEDFGSYEAWKGEFEAAASAAGGWALLVYDSFSNQLETSSWTNTTRAHSGEATRFSPSTCGRLLLLRVRAGPRRLRRQLLRGRRLEGTGRPLRAGRRTVRVSTRPPTAELPLFSPVTRVLSSEAGDSVVNHREFPSSQRTNSD